MSEASPPPPPLPIAVGSILQGTYRIERQLGTGGMGAVFAAAHVRLPKLYAVKVLHAQVARDPQDAARFRQEAEVASHLHHPHVVEVHDFNTLGEGGMAYIVMELLEGRDLGALIRSTGRLGPERTLQIVRDVADGLEAAHALGIIHRDLKPTNVFLAQIAGREVVKILDFGLSKKLDGSDVRTLTSQLMGTPAYMSPEQARGRAAEVDGRSDQFSLAAMVYEMLTGRLAFFEQDDSVYDVLERVVHADPPPLLEYGPGVQAVLWKALSKQREDRFPTLAEFVGAFAAALAEPGAYRPLDPSGTRLVAPTAPLEFAATMTSKPVAQERAAGGTARLPLSAPAPATAPKTSPQTSPTISLGSSLDVPARQSGSRYALYAVVAVLLAALVGAVVVAARGSGRPASVAAPAAPEPPRPTSPTEGPAVVAPPVTPPSVAPAPPSAAAPPASVTAPPSVDEKARHRPAPPHPTPRPRRGGKDPDDDLEAPSFGAGRGGAR